MWSLYYFKIKVIYKKINQNKIILNIVCYIANKNDWYFWKFIICLIKLIMLNK